MNKRELCERDIYNKFITPALTAAGWDIDSQIREEVGFTAGRSCLMFWLKISWLHDLT